MAIIERLAALVLAAVTPALVLGAAACGGSSTATAPAAPAGPPGTVALASQSATVVQAAGVIPVVVTRTGGTSGVVNVSYATSDGSAVAGTDYTTEKGALVWDDGDGSSKTVNVPISTAHGFDGTKTLTITLSTPSDGAALGFATETATISGTRPPSDFFALSAFSLTLPVDATGGTGGAGGIQLAATTVTASQLSGGFMDPYFYADALHRMVFVDPSNGAVTSPGSGSDHARSELRERYTGPGSDGDGDWSSVVGGTLTATCVVQAVSVNSDDVVMSQFLNGNPFMALIYRPRQKDVAVALRTFLGSDVDIRTPVIQNVNLGDQISYSIHYKGDTITVVVNGTVASFPVDATWAGSPVYFKLGAYHQAPNTGNPAGDHSQTAFTSFSISHP